jgi:hypothetical protein
MPDVLSQTVLALKVLRQLGPGQVGLYARYRLGLSTGWLIYKTRLDVSRALDQPAPAFTLHPLLDPPNPVELREILGSAGLKSLLAEADEIANGVIRPFGGEPVPLDLAQGASAKGWTAYALGRAAYGVQDVKRLWEPARFGWAFSLGRAYLLSEEERYADAFWRRLREFLDVHPPNIGPHWVSAQEVALRILTFVWAAQVFAPSPHTTQERLVALGRAVAAHASRIPATLSYARAQNNNHLLSEAVGLLTAGLSLHSHPLASDWEVLGWHWFIRGLLEQISPAGVYIQHSTNYHRLMLQLALWVHLITQRQNLIFPAPASERLSAATRWLLALLDRDSGRVPNLGPNDGAYIFPLTVCPYADYRPVLQAASSVFLGEPGLPSGIWDEMSMWLGTTADQEGCSHPPREETAPEPLVLRSPASDSWAYLRAARFASRPGHADQLHLDLWWRGHNLAQDAGTYLYNAPSPWENSLTHTAVHNTLTVNALEQMLSAGNFLYLDWAQAQVVGHNRAKDSSSESLTAQHDGYKQLGVVHQRTVTSHKDGTWFIEDHLRPVAKNTAERFLIRLHWLVPDWPWAAEASRDDSCSIDLDSPNGRISIQMNTSSSPSTERNTRLLIVRAGEAVYGDGAVSPTWGWFSPTYGVKLPALSLSFEVEAPLPVMLATHWLLPHSTGITKD